MNPELSIIIVNYNTKDYLRKCLSSIYKYLPSCSYEIICVDNHSKDGSKVMIKREFPQVKLITNARNVGFARACNQAAKRAKGEYILFLNPDTITTKGAIDNMLNFFAKTKDAGCVGARLLNNDGSLQFSCRTFPTPFNSIFGRKSLFTKFFPNNRMSRQFLLTDLDYEHIQIVDSIRGACILTKKEILEKVGFFDERFFLYVEDTDFCYKLKKANYHVYYLPTAVFFHKLEASVEKFLLTSTAHHHLGMYKFFLKNYKPSLFLRFTLYLALIIRVFSVTLPITILAWVRKS